MESVTTIPALRRLIRGLQARNISMRTGLQAYREAGGKVRTEDFATLWRDEKRKASA